MTDYSKKNKVNIIISLLNMPEYVWMCLNKQDSEYISGPKYDKILNMRGVSISERYTTFWIR